MTSQSNDKSIQVSLSDCCRDITGKPMDKRHTISNWDREDLTEALITYAHFLIDMFHHLEKVKKCQII